MPFFKFLVLLFLQTYTSNLEIMEGLSLSGKKEKFLIKLHGEGNVPQVSITFPKSKDISGEINVMFPPTFVGRFSTRCLEFKNIGIIPCKVQIYYLVAVKRFFNSIFTHVCLIEDIIPVGIYIYIGTYEPIP